MGTVVQNAHLTSPSRVLTDEEARVEAKEMYCTMGVARFAYVSRRVRRPESVIKYWAEEDGWLDARARHMQNKFGKMLKGIDNKQKGAVSMLKVLKKARMTAMSMLKRNLLPGELKATVDAIEKIDKVMLDCQSRLGM